MACIGGVGVTRCRLKRASEHNSSCDFPIFGCLNQDRRFFIVNTPLCFHRLGRPYYVTRLSNGPRADDWVARSTRCCAEVAAVSFFLVGCGLAVSVRAFAALFSCFFVIRFAYGRLRDPPFYPPPPPPPGCICRCCWS